MSFNGKSNRTKMNFTSNFLGKVNTDVDVDYNHDKYYFDGCTFQLNGEFWYNDSHFNEVRAIAFENF